MRFPRLLDNAANIVLAGTLLIEVTTVFINTVSRAFFNVSFLWIDETSQIALAALAFIGGAVAYRRGQHTSLYYVLGRLTPRAQSTVSAAADWLVFGLSIVIGVSAIPLLRMQWTQFTPILGISVTWMDAPLPLGMIFLMLFAGVRLWHQNRRVVLTAGIAVLAITAAILFSRPLWAPFISSAGGWELWVTLAFFGVVVLLGLPVGFALMVASLWYIYAADPAWFTTLPTRMLEGVSNFVLLALPFFVFAGLIMERGGLSTRLVDFPRALVGHAKGGLLQTAVLAMYLVSGMSGSKIADIAAVGSALNERLRLDGYESSENVAVLAASAVMGETVPPSIAMLVLGSITSVSIGSLFIAGIVPAALIGLALMLTVYVRARLRRRSSTTQFAWTALMPSFFRASPPLLMLVILFGGILWGIGTPTEVSSFAVVYGLALAVLGYHALNLRGFMELVVDAGAMAGMVLIIIAGASGFSWVLTIAQLPQEIVSSLTALHVGAPLFLILSIVFLIVMGAVLEGLPALLVLAPLLIPTAMQEGIDPLHYGVLLIIALGLGFFSPPVGAGLYVACAVGRASVEETTKSFLPYFCILLLGLLAIAFVPWFSLALPHAFGLR